jgi:gamma-glutamyltranspeptidase/glutathione hydrolase
MANHGMVASGHPLASMAGMRILEKGGNAIDAAVAAWTVQGLVEPGMTGLGSDAFILIYLAKTGEVKFINGTGPAPGGATPELYRSKGGIPDAGPLASDVPGALDAIGLALETYGTASYAEAFAPAIDLAKNGYPVSYNLAGQLERRQEKLAAFPTTKAIWFREGRPLRAGEIVVQKDYGKTLETVAAQGRRVFYEGEIAKTFAGFIQSQGGVLKASDLASYHAHEAEPIHVNYKGYEVYEAAPNSQGHVLLQAMNLLETFDLKYMEHNSAPYLHLVTESLKLAFADRDHYLGDPRFVAPIPIDGLLSKDYAGRRRALIDPNRALAGVIAAGDPSGTPTEEQGGIEAPSYAARSEVPEGVLPDDRGDKGLTTYLAVIDDAGNMVSITSSLCSGFGSGLVAGEGGFFMNNRMVYYFLDPDHTNVLVPGKRTRHTINPALVLKEGKPFMAFGTPGGDTQPQTELQFFLNLVEFGMNVQEALEQPAVISSYFQSSFWPHESANKLRVPNSLPAYVLEALAAKGHDLEIRDYRGVGSVKAVILDPKSGALIGGVSPSGDSYVIGW